MRSLLPSQTVHMAPWALLVSACLWRSVECLHAPALSLLGHSRPPLALPRALPPTMVNPAASEYFEDEDDTSFGEYLTFRRYNNSPGGYKGAAIFGSDEICCSEKALKL